MTRTWCAAGDDTDDFDGDGVADACDTCPADALDDSDGDGSCDSVDLCTGDDSAGDADGDGLCEDGNDLCLAGPDTLDFDEDGVADACDICPIVPTNDPGGDGTCDNVADLSGADLSGADLSGADLSGADLSGADLSGANLSGANLSGANLSTANLTTADLSNANLFSTNLSGALLDGVFWLNTVCPDGTSSNDNGNTCANNL